MSDSLALSVSGIVAADPTIDAPIGARMRFGSAPVTPEFSGRTETLENWEFFEGMLLSVGFGTARAFHVEGSAVLVAPGIALCAAHVVEPRMADLQAGPMTAMCQGITSHGLVLWRVKHVTFVPNTDLVILGLLLASDLPPDRVFLQARMTTRTPAIGDEILLCGFRAAEAEFAVLADGIEARGEVRISKGKISNTFPIGRDRGIMPWPALEVACPARGGMSGGPAFDSQGRLIGLVCSSIDLPDEDGISYVSMLWQALGTRFECSWPAGLMPSPTSLIEMDRRICIIDKPEAVVLRLVNGGPEYKIVYTPWS
jgi:hypothetical protein